MVGHLHPGVPVAEKAEEGVLDVHRRRLTVVGQKTNADLQVADVPGHRPAVVVVQDLVP